MTIFTQLRREIAAFFLSPIAYVLLVVTMIINGGVFFVIIELLSDPRSGQGAAMQMLFGGTIFYWFLVLVICPLITMRLLSEERHSGTLETLLTAPINDTQMVLAKYLAALVFWITLWIPSLAYVLVLSRYSQIDVGPILSGYLGTLTVGMMFLSIGLLCSALTKNQIIAALLSFAFNMGLFLLGIVEYLSSGQTGESVFSYINLWSHMEDFGRGIVDTRHLVFNLSVAMVVLFATVQISQSRRWRG